MSNNSTLAMSCPTGKITRNTLMGYGDKGIRSYYRFGLARGDLGRCKEEGLCPGLDADRKQD